MEVPLYYKIRELNLWQSCHLFWMQRISCLCQLCYVPRIHTATNTLLLPGVQAEVSWRYVVMPIHNTDHRKMTHRCGTVWPPSSSKLLRLHSVCSPIQVHCGNLSLFEYCIISWTDHTNDTPLCRRTTEKNSNIQTSSVPTMDSNGWADGADTKRLRQWWCPFSPASIS